MSKSNEYLESSLNCLVVKALDHKNLKINFLVPCKSKIIFFISNNAIKFLLVLGNLRCLVFYSNLNI